MHRRWLVRRRDFQAMSFNGSPDGHQFAVFTRESALGHEAEQAVEQRLDEARIGVLFSEAKLDDSSKLKRSLRKLLDYDFDVLLLCDGQSMLSGGKLKVIEFLKTLAE